MNCVKGISDPIDDDFVESDCEDKDEEEPALSEWKAVTSGNPAKYPLKTTYHSAFPNTFIYCYPHSITIGVTNKQTKPSPPYVFLLDSNI